MNCMKANELIKKLNKTGLTDSEIHRKLKAMGVSYAISSIGRCKRGVFSSTGDTVAVALEKMLEKQKSRKIEMETKKKLCRRYFQC